MSQTKRALIFIAFYALLFSCNSTTMSGTGKGDGVNNGKPSADDLAGDATRNSGDLEAEASGEGEGFDGSVVADDSDNDGDLVADSGDLDGDLVTNDPFFDSNVARECLQGQRHYNVVMAFDNTGSQKDNDPEYVRRTSAIQFVNRMAEARRINPTLTVNINAWSFGGENLDLGDYNWVGLDANTRENLIDEITKVTSKPGGYTFYIPSLELAESSLLEIYDSSIPNSRNFVVFLTDGRPNNGLDFDNLSQSEIDQIGIDISNQVDSVVNNAQAAMIAVASGAGIDQDGEIVVQEMAKPLIGNIDDDHVGRYRRAETDADLETVWDEIFLAILNCDQQKP